jgi:DNA-binding YbaB/EbfC family protein
MNLAKMMQQAKRMQDDMKSLQERLKTTEMAASVSGVSVVALGSGEVKKITIDPALIDPNDKETLEDVIVAALNAVRQKSEDMTAAETKKIMGGLQLPPGFSLPF